MKNKWSVKKLGELCDFINGLWEGKEPPYINAGVIRNANFTKDCKLDYSKVVYLNVEQNKFNKRKLHYGDIIIEKSGGGPKQPVGRVVIFDKTEDNFSFSNFTSVLRIKNSDELDFAFLYNFLFFLYISGITENMQSHSTGIRNLDFNKYKDISVPIPDIKTQKYIVKNIEDILNNINKIKTNIEKNLKNSKEVFEAYLQEVFVNKKENWEYKKLEDICDMINRGISPKYTESDGLCVLNQKCIRDHKINLDLSRLHDIKNKKVDEEKFIKIGDVLINSTGTGTLGRVAQVRELDKKIIVDSHITIVRPIKNMFYNDFFGYALIFIEKEIAKSGDGCGGQIELSRNKLKNDFKISYPISISEQKSIVEKLDKLSIETKKLEENYKEKLSNLEELKKSILEKAFNGEL